MANEEHLKILNHGVEIWNVWRKENSEIKINFRGADFGGFDLRRIDFGGASLNLANLSGADLRNANLTGAELLDATCNYTNMQGAYFHGANLSDVSLTGAYLHGAYFHSANLTDANLSVTDLTGAELIGADLRNADLSGATLNMARLNSANLCGAYLVKTDLGFADLHNVDFRGAVLVNTDFSDAEVINSNFAGIDLAAAKGVNLINHLGPSSLGVDTIRLSKGKLPVEFLQGCGLTDFEIVTAQLQNPDLSRNEFLDLTYRLDELRNAGAIDYYSCLISYSTKNQEFVEQLHEDLQESGVRCWFAPHDLKIGEKIKPALNRAVSMNEKLLLILSKDSIESQWVEYEVEAALKKERNEKTTMLFPIRIDDAVMETNEGWADYVKNARHIGDFSQWHDEVSYQTAFDRLKKDLQQNVEYKNGK